MISLGDIQTERRDGETVIPEDEEDKLLDKLADKVADRIGESEELRQIHLEYLRESARQQRVGGEDQ